MQPDADQRIHEFLAATLTLWQVEGEVEALPPPGVARICTNGRAVLIELERAPPGDPFRWYLRRVAVAVAVGDATQAARPSPPRPCGSLVGVLSGLRRMLGIDAGATVRIARSAR